MSQTQDKGTAGDPRSTKIRISNASRYFGSGESRFVALDGVTLDVYEKEFVSIVGPSGCGKSTLLRTLGGLDQMSDGNVHIERADGSRPLSAMIFQQESVFPWLTVAQNAAYGLKVTNSWDNATSQAKIDDLLKKTGLYSFRDFLPNQLSGGMKQRLSIVRAFATEPEVLLMDEPFAALDEQNRWIMQQELERLWSVSRNTVVFITHGLEEAVLLGDRVVMMTSAPGRIKHEVKIPFDRPRNLVELRRTPEFAAIAQEIWELLRDEVDKARQQESTRVSQRGEKRRLFGRESQ